MLSRYLIFLFCPKESLTAASNCSTCKCKKSADFIVYAFIGLQLCTCNCNISISQCNTSWTTTKVTSKKGKVISVLAMRIRLTLDQFWNFLNDELIFIVLLGVHNSLKLSSMNIWGLNLNFVDCKLSWHSCSVWDKPGWLNWSWQFLRERLSSFNPKGF